MARKLNPNTYHGWRKLVLIRDGYKCVLCGSEEKLEVDHIQPVKTHAHLIYDVSNGRVLCKSCHKKTDTYGGKMLKGTIRREAKYGSL